jgi:hypothetical protein
VLLLRLTGNNAADCPNGGIFVAIRGHFKCLIYWLGRVLEFTLVMSLSFDSQAATLVTTKKSPHRSGA